MQKRKKVMMVLMASMMIAAAMSQARASEISLEETLNTEGKIQAAMAADGEILMGDLDLTEGKIQATMMMKSQDEILAEMNEMMERALDLQEKANNRLIANDDQPTGFMSDFSDYGRHITLIGAKIETVAVLSEEQKEEIIAAYVDAQESLGFLEMLASKNYNLFD